MTKKKSPLQHLSKLLVMTSNTLLDSFLSDTTDKKNQTKKALAIRNDLQKAAQSKALVVIQLQGEKIGTYETVVGWIAGNHIGNQIVIKLKNDVQQLRIIRLEQILKVSSLLKSNTKIAE